VPDTSVCAVVLAPGGPGQGTAALAAVEAQTRGVDQRVVLDGEPSSFHAAITSARAHDPTWYWLLDDGVVPEPAALERLLAALDAIGDLPAPGLLASKVVGPDGGLDPHSVPWPPLLDREVTIGAAQRHLVTLRLVRWGSFMVHRDVLERHGPPRADFAGGADDLEWTARVLREGGGYLVPTSVATRRTAPRRSRTDGYAELRDRVRMVGGEDRWTAQEPVWWAFLAGVEAFRELKAHPRPRTAAQLARALGQGVTRRP